MGCSNSAEAAPVQHEDNGHKQSAFVKAPPPHVAEKDEGTRKTEWARVQALLPVKKTAEDKERRIKLFKQFDPNGNGKLSLAEIDNACQKILELEKFTNNLQPILIRAYNAAKTLEKKEKDDEFVEFIEFRMLLVYIYHYFELMVMYDEIDSSNDRRVTLEEFKKAVPQIEKWGLKIKDPEATFKSIDKNGGGVILFDEFCDFGTKSKLNADGHSGFE